jgi:hypothetical protein
MKGAKYGASMRELWSRDNCTGKAVLDMLKTVKLDLRKTIVERVTVVEFRMN